LIFLLIPRHPNSTLFPYTTLFRSGYRQFLMLAFAKVFADLVVLPPVGEDTREEGHAALPVEIAFPCRSHCRCRSSAVGPCGIARSEEHTSELQSRENLVCRLLLEK